jgi:hypothetical protein
MAVLPTPGSPIRTGCSWCGGEDLHGPADLLVAADDGVELALRASLDEVAAVALSAWYFFSGFWSVTRCPPRTSLSAARTSSCDRRPA